MKQNKYSHSSIIQITGVFLFFLLCNSLLAQDSMKPNQAVTNLISKTDSVLGLDDELVNGEIYYQKNLAANGHPFYISNDWLKGSVTVNGKTHYNLFLKLNVEDGQLIMKVTQKSGSVSSIVLNNGFIDSFLLDEHYFINPLVESTEGLPEDYCEELYSGNFSFFANYRKTFVSEYNNKNPYGKYSKTFVSFYIYDNGVVSRISSKGALLKYFELYKKDIKRYMSQNKIKFNKADTFQLNALMQYCDDLVNSK